MYERRVLALSGSLRTGSHNAALLRAAGKLAPPGVSVAPWDGLADVPMYHADLDTAAPPEPVRALRREIAAADALLLATPEYNASVPAVLKNAIDWASTAADASRLAGKPVAILGASPGALGTARAQLALRQILAAVGAEVVAKPEVVVFHAHERFDERGELADELTASLLSGLLTALGDRIAPKLRHDILETADRE
ncbi:NADPH-dependent FMN reductase [Amycolatopsis sp. CA-230715]|uniref:NADPH-dependent FMN reductase n=1 Tax=Amycolatopsis sp. CA-230715 TaxID=2745196 RepID=UPI001C00DAE7|nr:NADPH-dependent FMN reductase [Amycolatopsis sp. CA-230715]QWF81317.1 NAD(P)H-dependent FMN reductase [Amycolatopsis sp. CA-230715]